MANSIQIQDFDKESEGSMKRVRQITTRDDVHAEKINGSIGQNPYPEEVRQLAVLLFLLMFNARAREKKLVGIIADLIETNRALEKSCADLRDQAVKDPLTGLFNRRYMRATLIREAHRVLRRESAIGFVMIDVDHFKRVNDTHGHDVGDAVLSALGAFFQKHTRIEDIACRYGGEEFLLILPDISADDLCRRAEQMRKGIREALRFDADGEELRITVSMGVALFDNPEDDVRQAIKRADNALYEAKRNGRDKVVVASEWFQGSGNTAG